MCLGLGQCGGRFPSTAKELQAIPGARQPLMTCLGALFVSVWARAPLAWERGALQATPGAG